MNNNNFIIGIDATRNKSGGAIEHLLGIVNNFDIQEFPNIIIHVWSYDKLLNSIKQKSYIHKHTSRFLKKNILFQIIFQYFILPYKAKKKGCNILFYTDAGAFVNFKSYVVLSQDMLSYEKGEMKRYPFSKSKIRLWILKYIQIKSLKNADGAIFLTNYASSVIQSFTGKLKNYIIIPHGVSDIFRRDITDIHLNFEKSPINCIYVSNAALYKHQWHVIEAISNMREKGLNIKILLVGGGKGIAKTKLDNKIKLLDPNLLFVKQLDFVKHNEIPNLIFNSDIFIFASSCENLPITLIEGMSTGIPIVCSNRGPMPEVLKDAGYYFDPEKPKSIENAINNLLSNKDETYNKTKLSLTYSKYYSWKNCSTDTINFILKTYINKYEI